MKSAENFIWLSFQVQLLRAFYASHTSFSWYVSTSINGNETFNFLNRRLSSSGTMRCFNFATFHGENMYGTLDFSVLCVFHVNIGVSSLLIHFWMKNAYKTFHNRQSTHLILTQSNLLQFTLSIFQHKISSVMHKTKTVLVTIYITRWR